MGFAPIDKGGRKVPPEMEEFANPYERLNPKQITAIEALTTVNGYNDAAEQAGVSRQTLRVWLRDPVFRGALRAAQSEMFDSLSAGLMRLADSAIEAYTDILTNPTAPGSAIRRAAASDVVSHATKLHEIIGLEDRITDLEARLIKPEEWG